MSLHVCTCGLLMARETATGAVKFRCMQCNRTEEGSPYDARIGGKSFTSSETADIYDTLLRNLARSEAGKKVPLEAPCACGLDFATEVRLGESETVIRVCSCGRRS